MYEESTLYGENETVDSGIQDDFFLNKSVRIGLDSGEWPDQLIARPKGNLKQRNGISRSARS